MTEPDKILVESGWEPVPTEGGLLYRASMSGWRPVRGGEAYELDVLARAEALCMELCEQPAYGPGTHAEGCAYRVPTGRRAPVHRGGWWG